MVDVLRDPDVYFGNSSHQPAAGILHWNCHSARLVNPVRGNFTSNLCFPLSQRWRISLAGTPRRTLWDRRSLYADESTFGRALSHIALGSLSSFRRNPGAGSLLSYPPDQARRLGSVRRHRYTLSWVPNLDAVAVELGLDNWNIGGDQFDFQRHLKIYAFAGCPRDRSSVIHSLRRKASLSCFSENAPRLAPAGLNAATLNALNARSFASTELPVRQAMRPFDYRSGQALPYNTNLVSRLRPDRGDK
jgi:hypothetical protein